MDLYRTSKHNILPEDIFEGYFYNFYEGLHRYAFSILKDNEDAKDIVQSAFIKLWEKRDEVDIRHSVRSYLYKTVYNSCLNYIRNKKVRNTYINEYIPTGKQTYKSSDYEEKEAVKKILALIEQLSPACREVFSKSRFEGKKYGDIAAELSISVKTVEAHIGKALKVLRTLLSNVIIIGIIAILSYGN